MYILRLLYPNPIYSKQDQPINSVVLVAQACVKKHLFEACRGQVACSSWLRCNKNSMYHERSGKMKQKPERCGDEFPYLMLPVEWNREVWQPPVVEGQISTLRNI